MMLALRLLAASSILLSMLPLQDQPEEPAPKPKQDKLTAKEIAVIESNLDLLEFPDKKIREAARAELAAFGVKTLPHLEARLSKLKALEVHRFIRDLQENAVVRVEDLPDSIRKLPPELAKLAVHPKRIRKISRKDADQYLLAKVHDAFMYAAREEYEAAERVLLAIRTIEPSWGEANRVTDLLRYVQGRIVEGKVLKPIARAKQPVLLQGDMIEIEVEIANPFDHALTLEKYETFKPMLKVHVHRRIVQFNGQEEGSREEKIFDMPKKLVLEPGEKWTQTVKVETGSDYRPKMMRLVEIGIGTSHVQIESSRGKMVRQIYFPPVRVRTLPAHLSDALEDPLKALDVAMGPGGGTTQDVFTCLMVLKDTEKFWQGIARFMKQFSKADTRLATTLLIPMLAELTGYRPGMTKAAWTKWWREKKKTLRQQYPLVREFQ